MIIWKGKGVIMCRGFKFTIVYRVLVFSCVILAAFASSFVFADSNISEQESAAEIISKAVQENRILYKLTTLDEFKRIVGQPEKETTQADGGMEVCDIAYSGVHARFGKMKDKPVPFTILWIEGGGREFDIGQNRQIVLRDANDLNKFDSFWGFANVSLVNLDLRGRRKLLDDMPFDSLTKWPEPNKLPEGFQPSDLLEKGKNPGLGIRKLHEEGIDGKGVCIAIIDQPLLKEHIEYADRLVRYEPIDVQGVPVQMHGPPVCSIAVGKTCGVAPKASLYYYAVPPWKWLDNKPWADTLNKIIELNKSLKESEKIRVVSISLGAFSQRPNFDLWKQAVDKANQNAILVVTCDPTFLHLAMLKRKENSPADLPSSYEAIFNWPDADLLVLTGNRTIASYKGPDVYHYERQGGLSWAVPYLAGLAALAYQLNPEIKPHEIVKLWRQTAVRTDAGPVVNPPSFVDAVRKIRVK
jgi:serine protease AprX